MRACPLLFVFILAPSAARAGERDAARLAARALLTAKAMADRPDQAEALARRVIMEFVALDASNAGKTKDRLLREIGRVLDHLRLTEYDEDYVKACDKCARLSGDDPRWIARALANSVLREGEDVEGWIAKFEKIKEPDENLARAAAAILNKDFWSRPAGDIAAADRRARLLELLKAAHKTLSSDFAASVGKAAAAVAALSGADAKRGVYALNKLMSAWPGAGATLEGSLPKLEVKVTAGPGEPVEPERYTVESVVVEDVSIPLADGRAYLHPGLTYLIRLKSKDGETLCLARFGKGATLRVPVNVKKGHALLHRLADGKSWLMPTSPWSEYQLAMAFFEAVEGNTDKGDQYLKAESALKQFCNLFNVDRDAIAEDTQKDKFEFGSRSGPQAARTLTALPFIDIQLPPAALLAAVPRWARKPLGWRGTIVAQTGDLGVKPWTFYPVIEVRLP